MVRRHRAAPVSSGLGTRVRFHLVVHPDHQLLWGDRLLHYPRELGRRERLWWLQLIHKIINLKQYSKWVTPLVKKGVFTYKRINQRVLKKKSLNCTNH